MLTSSLHRMLPSAIFALQPNPTDTTPQVKCRSICVVVPCLQLGDELLRCWKYRRIRERENGRMEGWWGYGEW